MEFRCLGPLAVVDAGRPVPLRGPKQRLVLAHLLLRANRVVPTDRLVREVWGDDPPDAARNALQSYVSRLRSSLGSDRIDTRDPGYVLVADGDEVDALRFERLTSEGRRALTTDPAGAVELLEVALALWRGRPFADLADEPSLQADISRLEGARLEALEDRLAAQLEVGRHHDVVTELESLVEAHPLRERLWGSLLVALYRDGRQADALARYRHLRGLLADELGVDPSPELQRLHGRVLRQDPSLDPAIGTLRGYRLLEEIGAGTSGVVFRAVQPHIDREVAVKAIRPALASAPRFIRRFEAEARLVARLEHPHIVPLYDYWRDPSGAYLVMRWIRGGSLAAALSEGPLPPPAAVDVLDQIAGALSTGHRAGVVHRDVTPSNILLDDDGHAYLSDFGIARDAIDGEVCGSEPSPYRSPEELRGEPASPLSDVYSLGAVGRAIVSGSGPNGPPAAVCEVLDRATAQDPSARFPGPVELAAAFRAVVTPTVEVHEPPAVSRNPYKGLHPFVEADTADFHGREAVVARLVDRLASPGPAGRCVVVVGPSGSGKSSVVRAGLIPAIREGRVPGSSGWFVIDLVPGARPVEELAEALLGVAVDPPADLVDRLASDPDALRDVLPTVLPPATPLLLFIDQFEDLFSLVHDEATREQVLDLLARAVDDPDGPLRLVVALRADRYDGPLGHRRFAALIGRSTVALEPLAAEEIERAVTVPARDVGVRVEPGLVGSVVSDVVGQPGSLPLLQYALTELFEARDGRVLSRRVYEEMGGVTGALVRRAEEVFQGLEPPAREATRRVLLGLVEPHEDGGWSRRRVLRSELEAAGGEHLDEVFDAFGAARLLAFDRDASTRSPTVELAHEALLREWPRLRAWTADSGEDLRMIRRLSVAAAEWEEAHRDPSFLLSGARLGQVEEWTARSDLALGSHEAVFVRSSVQLRDDRLAAEETRREREAAAERRSRRRLRALVVVLAVGVIATTALVGVALVQRGEARTQALTATARELAAASVANLEIDPERSILLALRAVDTTRVARTDPLPEAEEALRRALRSSRIEARLPRGGAVAVAPDGTTIAVGDPNGAVTLFEAETSAAGLTLTGHDGPVRALAFSPSGRELISAGEDGTVRLWDLAVGVERRRFHGHSRPVLSVAVSPDGETAASGALDAVRVWDVATGAEIGRSIPPSHTIPYLGVAFHPEGDRAAAPGRTGDVVVWDIGSGSTTGILRGHRFDAVDIAFSPDGTLAATAGLDGIARIFDADTDEPTQRLDGHRGPVTDVAFAPDGRSLATGSVDGTVRTWDVETGAAQLVLSAHAAPVTGVAFMLGGDRLVTTSEDGATLVWDVGPTGSREWRTFPAERGAWVMRSAVSGDGELLAGSGPGGQVTVWRIATGAEVASWEATDQATFDIVFHPDGSQLATGGTDGRVTIWEATTGRTLVEAGPRAAWINAVPFDPAGDLVAVATDGGHQVEIRDATTGDLLAELSHPVAAWDVDFADSDQVVTADERGTIRIWDWRHERQVTHVDGHGKDVVVLDAASDGRVVTGGWEGTVRIWDPESGDESTFQGQGAAVEDVAFDPTGTRVATANHDGTITLWDATSARRLLQLHSHEDMVTSVAFSADGRWLVSSSIDGTHRVHVVPIDDLADLARERLTRGFTDEECRQYLHEPTCRS